jgi:hypothetical protein
LNSHFCLSSFELSRELVAISMDLFDRYVIACNNECSGNFCLLVSLTTLHLALKLQNVYETLADEAEKQSLGEGVRCDQTGSDVSLVPHPTRLQQQLSSSSLSSASTTTTCHSSDSLILDESERNPEPGRRHTYDGAAVTSSPELGAPKEGLNPSKKRVIKLDLSTLASLSRGQFDQNGILAMEWNILATLQWKLHHPSAYSYILYLLLILQRSGYAGEQRRQQRHWLDMSRYIAELAVCDSYFVGVPNFVIAMASILNVVEGTANCADRFQQLILSKFLLYRGNHRHYRAYSKLMISKIGDARARLRTILRATTTATPASTIAAATEPAPESSRVGVGSGSSEGMVIEKVNSRESETNTSTYQAKPPRQQPCHKSRRATAASPECCGFKSMENSRSEGLKVPHHL